MILKNEHWIHSAVLLDANWFKDWNNNQYLRIESILKEKISWQENTIVYFCVNSSNIIETTWKIFSRYWINFLFEDEGPILISIDCDEYLTFGPRGQIFKGNKNPG